MDDLLTRLLSEIVIDAPLIVFLIYALRWMTNECKNRIDLLEGIIARLNKRLEAQIDRYEDYVLRDKEFTKSSDN